MSHVFRVPRSRGALSGAVLVVLGAWGALIPFIGPYFHYSYTPDTPWVYTSARLWLEIVPGAVTVIGGLILLGSANRAVAALGAWLAAVAGVWFIAGPTLATVWASSGFPQLGSPVGGTLRRALEQVGFFSGLGVVIVFFAAFALGRLAVVASREAEREAAAAQAADAAHPRKETTMLRGFRNFLMQGDLIVIAVGLVVALAFSALIGSFTDNIITPLVNAAGGGAAGEGLGWTVNGQRIDLGAFIGSIIYFII